MFRMPRGRAIEVLAAVALTVGALAILVSELKEESEAPKAAITAPAAPAGRSTGQLPAARQTAAPAATTGKAGKSPRTEFPR